MTRDTFAQVGKYGLAYSLFHALFIVGFIAQGAVAISVQYCANFNTGSDNPPVTNIYQSNGACSDNCKASYAFAVVQGSTCWCSNYAPASSSSGCNEACPGYPSEKCGNTIEGLFGYIPLNKAPSGTRGGSSSSDRAIPSSAPTTSTPTTNSPSTGSDPPPNTPSSSLVSSSTSMTWTPTPYASLYTTTGIVQTITVTPTAPPLPTTAQNSDGGFFNNAGKVAGLFAGLAVIVLLTAALILFCCWRRRQARSQLISGENAIGTAASRPQSRSMSQLGLMGDSGRSGVSRISTSMWAGADATGDSPTSIGDRRISRAVLVDQRLDPQSLWNPLHDNSSRVSFRSLQDDRDYSRRVLKLANPDPE